MKKVCVAMVLVMVCLAVFTACSQPATQPSTPSSPSTSPAPSISDKPIELKVAFGEPAQAFFFWAVLEPWGQEIEEKTGGRVTFRHFHSAALGPANEDWDLVVKGVADASWHLCSYTPDRFPLSEIVVLPSSNIRNAKQVNKVLHDMHASNEYFQKEYEENKVLYFAGGPPQYIWSIDPIRSLDDMKGKRLGVNGAWMADIVELLGGTPVYMIPSDMYLSLEKGIIDGVLLINEAMLAFKLGEICKNCVQIDLSCFPAVVSMNWDSWNSLPADLQDTIMQVSEEWNDEAGVVVDKINYEDCSAALKDGGTEYYVLPEDVEAQWYSLLEPMLGDWVAGIDDRGMPGQDILDEIMNISKNFNN